jgi:hypothetical protein
MSGKAKRSAEKARRRKEKQGRKERNRARYEELKRTGQNSKSKRHRLNTKRNRVSPGKHLHEISNCGNLGCKQCFSQKKKDHVIAAELKKLVGVERTREILSSRR